MSEFRPEARAIIQAGRAVLLPTQADRERVFAALAVRLGFTAEPPPPALVATKASLGWQAIALSATGLVLASLVTYATLFTRHAPVGIPAPVRAPALVTPPAPPEPPTAAAVSDAAPLAQETVSAEPRAVNGVSSAHARHTDSLAEEVALLGRAETELHAGRFANALALLDTHARTFPRGVLRQERIAARVHALCGLGRTSEANAELARITPGSLQESSAREACGESH